nr:MAG TPA: hypothetical protein [Caudoviricetes sp.]
MCVGLRLRRLIQLLAGIYSCLVLIGLNWTK